MQSWSYARAAHYLETLIPYRLKESVGMLRLERIEHLLKLAGNPEKSFPSIHIGGTAGKGSTAYITAAILREAGYKTGLHVSPHLERVNERLQVNGVSISDRVFAELISRIAPLVEQVGRENPFGKPSYFETLVAASFLHFRREKIDIAVVEVGLGGAMDATNVINPLVAVLTNVHLDHTHILGKTVEKIARDKAGIIKTGIGVITAATQKSVLKIIRDRCGEKHADLKIVRAPIKSIPTALKGAHQQTNIACALAAVRVLKKRGFKIASSAITQALQKVRIPGRFESVVLQIGKLKLKAVLDGAHNPVKMKALAGALKQEFPNQKIIFIVAVKKTKDVKGMMRRITPIAKKFFITQFYGKTDLGAGASMAPEKIKQAVRRFDKTVPVTIIENPLKALKTIKRESKAGDIICITGSLYLVGEIRRSLLYRQ